MQQLDNQSIESAEGLVQNNILTVRRRRKITGRELAERMAGVSPSVFSTIENGRVMPKKADLKVMCEMLRCAPTDLYSLDQLHLIGGEEQQEGRHEASPGPSSRNHAGQKEFRSWLKPTEREALRGAVMALGYRSEAEWLREMIRNTVARSRRLELSTSGQHKQTT